MCFRSPLTAMTMTGCHGRGCSLHTLGNLTLTGYNPELGNGSFADKKTAFAESNVSLNQHFIEMAQWSDQEIKQRALELARIVVRIWPRPSGGPGYIAPAPTPPEQGEFVEVETGEQRRGGSKLLIQVRWSRLWRTDGAAIEKHSRKLRLSTVGEPHSGFS
jgi:Protein of unknown function (DUF1524)